VAGSAPRAEIGDTTRDATPDAGIADAGITNESSGDERAPEPTAPFVLVTPDVLDLGALVTRVSGAGVGAIASFLGTVRDHHEGRAVTGIEYEAYEPMASLELARVAGEAVATWPSVRVAVAHRVGTLAVGDASVVIAVGSARRAPALEAMRFVIETLKVRVPIWKREHYVDGTRAWVDPTRPTEVHP
jgi:molybdopterin synthase catalytic subunit